MEQFAKNAQRMLARATALGLQGKLGQPVVIDQMEELEAARQGFRSNRAARAVLKSRKAAVLTLDSTAEAGNVFNLDESATDVWIQMAGFNVHLNLTAEGIVADVFALGAENESIGSTYAFNSDAEQALADELNVDYDDLCEWVGLHYKRVYHTETPAKRREWIQRYHETQMEANQTAANPQLDALEDIGYGLRFQFSTPSQDGGWVWEAPSDQSEGVFSSEEEALDAAWQDAATQVKSIQQLSDEAWAQLSLEEQCRLVRLLGHEDLGPVMPEKQCCVECGLPTSVDDDGLCNACSAKLG